MHNSPPMDEPAAGDQAPESLLWIGDQKGDAEGISFTTVVGNDASNLMFEDNAAPGPSNDDSLDNQEVPQGNVFLLLVCFCFL